MSNLVFEPDPEKRPGFDFRLPGTDREYSAPRAYWADVHRRLGQELAKRMRVYPGPSTDPDGGDIGGTPAAAEPIRLAA